jgi:hypothetical protein
MTASYVSVKRVFCKYPKEQKLDVTIQRAKYHFKTPPKSNHGCPCNGGGSVIGWQTGFWSTEAKV